MDTRREDWGSDRGFAAGKHGSCRHKDGLASCFGFPRKRDPRIRHRVFGLISPARIEVRLGTRPRRAEEAASLRRFGWWETSTDRWSCPDRVSKAGPRWIDSPWGSAPAPGVFQAWRSKGMRGPAKKAPTAQRRAGARGIIPPLRPGSGTVRSMVASGCSPAEPDSVSPDTTTILPTSALCHRS